MSGQRLKVLIADDSDLLREVLQDVFQDEGFEVVGQARDGLEAVERTAALQPDLVLMDLGLPGISGYEATRRIRADHPTVKVIGFSMHASEEVRRQVLEAGAIDYLLKDDPLDRLVAAIRQVAVHPPAG